MANKCPQCNADNPDIQSFCGDCGTQLDPQKDIGVTQTLETPMEEPSRGSLLAGRYEIIEELGSGGMGRVFRVEDTKLKQEVALKLIRPEISSDKKTIERFRNELKTARMISHTNVCRMFDLGEAFGAHFITMEYVDGQDLKGLIRQTGRLAAETTIAIAKQLCEGLIEAHKLNIVHRDLKPSNIMIDRKGNVRIMDFGIAWSLKAKGLTHAGMVIGTPEYMSPEQVEGKDVDQRSDIYSFGVILYEMAVGKVPFEGDSPLSIAHKHKYEVPQEAKEINPQIPDNLNRLILKCLQKEKEDRYQSAEEVHSELESIGRSIPLTEEKTTKRKPLTSKEITVTFNLRRLFIPALIVIIFIAAALAIMQVISQKQPAPLRADKTLLAIMYFENNTGDASLDIWSTALSDLLISDLSQSKYIKVLSRDRLFGILRQLNLLDTQRYSSENLKEVATRGEASHILQGILTKAGGNFRINTILQESNTMEIVGSNRVEGIGEESFYSMVDELTRRIKGDFRLSNEEIASDIDRRIGEITTSFPEAYKYYIEGLEYHRNGDYPRAIQFYNEAVAIDNEFATAFISMSMAYGGLDNWVESEKYLQKAFELSDRVSDRERYRIQASFYSSSEETYDKAIEAYNKSLEIYPGDLAANNNLAILYRSLEEWDKAIERLEVLIKNKETSIFPYANQAVTYQAKGLYEDARKVLEDYLHNFSDRFYIRLGLAETYFCQRKYDLALMEAEKAFLLDPDFYLISRLIGNIYLCKGEIIEAEERYQKLLDTKELSANLEGIKGLGALYLLQGRFKESRDQFERGIELVYKLGEKQWRCGFHLDLAYCNLKSGYPKKAQEESNRAWRSAVEINSVMEQRYAMYYKGLAFIELKAIDEAQRIADELKELIDGGMNNKAIRYYYHLVGLIQLERENFSDAIKYFYKALDLMPSQYVPEWEAIRHDQALFIAPLALVFFKSGNLEKARETYMKITLLTIGRMNQGDIYAKSFYMLGKIHEQQGDTAKAIEYYEKFLALWTDADPGIAEVGDAKKRLAGSNVSPI